MAKIRNYEDVTVYSLDPERELELRRLQRECTFIWSNKQGEPVGVIMSYLDTPDGKLWLTGSEQRVRFAAIARDPRTCVVITSRGTPMGDNKTITYKGVSVIRDKTDRKLKDWFYPAFAEKVWADRGQAKVKQSIGLLDSPNRVIVEFTPTKKIVFDGDKMAEAASLDD